MIAVAVIGVGVLTGIVLGALTGNATAPDLDDPHINPTTIRRFAARHRVVRRVARAAPQRSTPEAAEVIALTAVTLIAVAALVGVTLVMIRANFGLARVDLPVAEWAAEHATERSTTIMRELSKFGGTSYIVGAAIALAAFSSVRDRRWAVVAFVFIVMIGQFLVSNSIKWSVDRARPSLSNLTGYSGTSFPSGHAVAAAAAWAAVALVLGRGRSRAVRGGLVGTAVGLAVIVAGTRVALGVHWTTDVLIGLAIGWSWFAVCALVFGGRVLHPAAPVEAARSAPVDARRH